MGSLSCGFSLISILHTIVKLHLNIASGYKNTKEYKPA
jgi:hypothetical protein